MAAEFPPAASVASELGRPLPPILVVAEVTCATAVVVAAYKWLKTIEPAGFNASPGLTMMLAATAMLLVHRRDFASYGILSKRWRFGVSIGLAFGLISLAMGLVELALFPLGKLTPTEIPTSTELGIAAIRLPGYTVILLLLTRVSWQRAIERMSVTLSMGLLIVLLAAAPLVAIYLGGAVDRALGLTASLALCTGFGEELFFRGYVQSRLNGAFGRPWRLLGATIGPGLLVASLLFGLIHVFNPTRPFAGEWEFSWLWGANAMLGGLLYGYLREMTGSIWAGTIVHALTGVYRGLGQVFL
jgi:uncharacterized protein